MINIKIIKKIDKEYPQRLLKTKKSPEKLYVEGDYNRLKQVFINLFKNSLESKRKEDLVVNVKIKEDNNNCIISMKDNGNGMSKETLEKIYNDFFTTKETGTGIGIPYIKEIIELHHGTLTYKSRENRGTTVLITLPKKQEKKS